MEGSIEEIILRADAKNTNLIVRKALENTLCPICQDHMFIPFMTQCGHNFCYECITNWLNTSQTCPSCRAELDQQPFLNRCLQDLMETVYETSKSLNDTTLVDIQKDREFKLNKYKKDLKLNVLFQNIFQNTATAIIDNTDGVSRCSGCHWEVSGRVCENCGLPLRSVGYVDIVSSPDTDFEYEHELDADEEYSDYGENRYRADGFVVDEEEEEEEEQDNEISGSNRLYNLTRRFRYSSESEDQYQTDDGDNNGDNEGDNEGDNDDDDDDDDEIIHRRRQMRGTYFVNDSDEQEDENDFEEEIEAQGERDQRVDEIVWLALRSLHPVHANDRNLDDIHSTHPALSETWDEGSEWNGFSESESVSHELSKSDDSSGIEVEIDNLGVSGDEINAFSTDDED